MEGEFQYSLVMGGECLQYSLVMGPHHGGECLQYSLVMGGECLQYSLVMGVSVLSTASSWGPRHGGECPQCSLVMGGECLQYSLVIGGEFQYSLIMGYSLHLESPVGHKPLTTTLEPTASDTLRSPGHTILVISKSSFQARGVKWGLGMDTRPGPFRWTSQQQVYRTETSTSDQTGVLWRTQRLPGCALTAVQK
ncbi:hypothetical protein P7K49_002259 [Saguinus oedipus]|uniref:Uncharacterized protein n=1 Tax=Saguinus oedipus TaxID=9490 RepID=A0ABQ9WGW7_SAGOE|nr:hypothetical protein P7K49_002259 [Saguinus oedipus]